MPILNREKDIFPDDLFENEQLLTDPDSIWWCIYTMSRREKDLMRRLAAMEIPFYGPVIPKRYRSPTGRLRTSYVPLFPNYVFMYASVSQRNQAITSNCISHYNEINDPVEVIHDLRQIKLVIESGIALSPESRLEPGNHVRVRTGPFAGYEGTVVRREGRTRLLLSIRFLEQGVSMEMDEGLLEPL